MKRSRGYFEAEADRGGHHGDDEQRVQRRSVDGGRDLQQVGGVAKAVEQAEAVEQEGSGHSTEEEIFERGLGGARALLVEAGEDVQREAQQLQRDEDHQDVLRRDEEEHARSGKQDKQNELTDMFGECGIDAEQQVDKGEQKQGGLQKMRQ